MITYESISKKLKCELRDYRQKYKKELELDDTPSPMFKLLNSNELEWVDTFYYDMFKFKKMYAEMFYSVLTSLKETKYLKTYKDLNVQYDTWEKIIFCLWHMHAISGAKFSYMDEYDYPILEEYKNIKITSKGESDISYFKARMK